jgi:hypothetical protein
MLDREADMAELFDQGVGQDGVVFGEEQLHGREA